MTDTYKDNVTVYSLAVTLNSDGTLGLTNGTGSGIIGLLNNGSNPATLSRTDIVSDITTAGSLQFLGDVPNNGIDRFSTNSEHTENYIGLAYDNNGNFVGFVGRDNSVANQYYLFQATSVIVNGTTTTTFSPAPVALAAGAVITIKPTVNNSNQFNLLTGQAVCFMPGTLVSTSIGEVCVEDLKAGDMVLTADGRQAPINWLGRQTVSTIFADPLRVMPIRIIAGALGENIPARDLLISPDHAILVDDVLVHASALVNGVSIVRETHVPRIFTYYHIELADHSLIKAENVPAETFIDNVDRLAFDNWAEHQALYPDGYSVVEMTYPRAKSARQVPLTIRRRLSARANMMLMHREVAAA